MSDVPVPSGEFPLATTSSKKVVKAQAELIPVESEIETDERLVRMAKLKVDLAKAKTEEVKSVLERWNKYIEFAFTKVGGVAAIAVGVAKLYAPVLGRFPEPGNCIALGTFLLTGKSILGLYARATRADGKE